MQEMKSLGVGTDIEDIDRFRNLDRDKNSNFLKKIFTEKEIDYSFSNGKPHHHLAVRYVGKEAVVKALGSVGRKNINYKDIEILNDDTGVPRVSLNNNDFNGLKIKISLSHSDDRALAFAVIVKNE